MSAYAVDLESPARASGRQPVVLVSGAIANKLGNGGEAWVRLNWLLGLRRLGYAVYFVEQIRSEVCVDEAGLPARFEDSANRRYFDEVMRAFGFTHAASLLCDEGRRAHGLRYREIMEIAGSADLLVNISGHLTLEPVLRRVRRKAYIDLDPGFTQFWHLEGRGAGLEGHDFYFTVGENIGTPACSIPTCGLRWRHKRRFLVLDHWPMRPPEGALRFTTVAAWRGCFGPVVHSGRTYGLKVHEFRKLMRLPRLVPQTFEIALDIHPADRADREALCRDGWRLVDPRAVAADPFAYRRYLQGSGAEFSAAQGIYVDTSSGWLSDRTIRYLASGRPALVQDTGFSRNYPVGEGLVPFRTLEEAAAGANRIASDYARHSRAARELAETYFDSDRVLGRMLDQMGVAV